MNNNELEQRIKESLVNGKLPCANALGIADELGVPPMLVRETADEMGIKISSCQLGCFP
ncbi:MAG: hypothetical protein R6U37_08490 [Dehalococcoidia bacterium]